MERLLNFGTLFDSESNPKSKFLLTSPRGSRRLGGRRSRRFLRSLNSTTINSS